MDRQLENSIAHAADELEKQGMKFLLENNRKIFGEKTCDRSKVQGWHEVEADLVVMAVGIRPNVQLAKDSGIEINRGIVVNDYMETNMPNIYSVGECAEHRGIAYGLVAPLYEQGGVLAKRLAGVEARLSRLRRSTKLKVSGVDVFSAGQYADEPDTRAVRYRTIRGIYKKVVIRGR